MPGYPLVVVTTDVLREGADLHTFCKDVYHYGISWTPSSMEQRTGRVDRIRSLAQRNLDKRDSVTSDEFLQVYYPHLRETVERIQVERVYERLNKFVRMLHKQLSGEHIQGSSSVNLAQDILLRRTDIEPIPGPLKSSFEVNDADLHPELAVKEPRGVDVSAKLLTRFKELMTQLMTEWEFESETSKDDWKCIGTLFVGEDGKLVAKGKRKREDRQQPVTIFLQSGTGDGTVFLRCVSPVGPLDFEDSSMWQELKDYQRDLSDARICVTSRDRLGDYLITVESDHLFDVQSTTIEDLKEMIAAAVVTADELEDVLLEEDKSMSVFHEDLQQEGSDAEIQ
jgi:hypothetical protein